MKVAAKGIEKRDWGEKGSEKRKDKMGVWKDVRGPKEACSELEGAGPAEGSNCESEHWKPLTSVEMIEVIDFVKCSVCDVLGWVRNTGPVT